MAACQRVSPQAGNRVKSISDMRGDAHDEIMDTADYNLPFLGKAIVSYMGYY